MVIPKTDNNFLPTDDLDTSSLSEDSKISTDKRYSNETLSIQKGHNDENVLKTDIPVVEKLVNAGTFLFFR